MVKRLMWRRATAAAALVLLVGACAHVHAAPPQAPPAGAAAGEVTIPFSDPSAPGTVRVNLVAGSVTVRGENRKDVSIQTTPVSGERDGRSREEPAPPGLRRITPAGGYQVSEEHNEMTITAAGTRRGAYNLEIHVPTRTALHVSTANGRAVTIDGVEGDIEANDTNGAVTVTNVSGSVVASSVNGKVVATLTRVTPGKAMAFTSLNGSVDVTLPASTKASLRLQSERGDIFTDFDIQAQASAAPRIDDTRRRDGRYRIQVNRAVTGTINGGGPTIELRTMNGSVYLRKRP